jgi:hypothetical protein
MHYQTILSTLAAISLAVVQAAPVGYDPKTVVGISIEGVSCFFGPYKPAGTFILVCGETNTPCALGDLSGAGFKFKFLGYPENSEHYGKCPSVKSIQEGLAGLLGPKKSPSKHLKTE